jgi:predicted ABC-type transport system involved in lysophospholipase L1 biosynthesis ATPase subunit
LDRKLRRPSGKNEFHAKELVMVGGGRCRGQRGRQVMELFRKVAHERGSAVIVVTHDHRSLDVFNRTYKMKDGQLRGK